VPTDGRRTLGQRPVLAVLRGLAAAALPLFPRALCPKRSPQSGGQLHPQAQGTTGHGGLPEGTPGLFAKLLPRLEADAKVNAERSRRDACTDGEDNPSTEVHTLVAYLQQLKDPT